MKVKIVSLEKTVKYQAERLTELENRSRRNNLLVFGVEGRSKESEADLKKAVVNYIFGKQLGVEVKSNKRIHLIGKKASTKMSTHSKESFFDGRENDSVLQNFKKLKGSCVSISNNYAHETVVVRKICGRVLLRGQGEWHKGIPPR